MSEWQDISTMQKQFEFAPSDDFLFWDGDAIIKGSVGFHRDGSWKYVSSEDHTYDSWSGHEYAEIRPTHWMPLPPPPSIES